MDPTAEANKKRTLLIDLNELPPPDPDDSTSGATDQDSLPPPPAAAAGVKSGLGNWGERQVDENGGDGKKEVKRSERKRRRPMSDSWPRTAGYYYGGVQVGRIETWKKWGTIIQTVAWELGEEGLVDWMELMNRERPETAGSTARNGPRRDEDRNSKWNNNIAAEEVFSGAAPRVVAAMGVAAAASPEVVTRKSGRMRTLPTKYKDSILLERLP